MKSIATHPSLGDVIHSQQVTYDVFCCKGLGWAKAGGQRGPLWVGNPQNNPEKSKKK